MDHYSQSSQNFFTASSINRLAEKRKDESWFQEQLRQADSLFLPVWQGKNLLSQQNGLQPVSLNSQEAAQLTNLNQSILLGELEEKRYFALPLKNSSAKLEALGSWEELRWKASLLAHDLASLVVYAKAMIYWHSRNQYCGDCGHENDAYEAGHMLKCRNPEQPHLHFPRTDPAVIILIYKDDKCLLARNANWPEGNYSTIAGFVELGESLEDTVMREAKEETGVAIKSMHYYSSQPWAFPRSLMLGYLAEAASTQINLEDDELEDARWFTRQELKERVEAKTINLPPPVAIAHKLIETWFDKGEEGRFKDLNIDQRH